jgi:choline dehydrogenase-like flavoprotein
MALTPAQAATLQALCRRMAALPPEPDPAAARLAGAVEARLATLPPEDSARIRGLLSLLGHPATAALTSASPYRFSRLPPDRQDAWLKGWELSRIPLRRTLFQALRRLVLSTRYADPATFEAIGYRGPLHDRRPAVPWEGPALGETTDAEPIAREKARAISLRSPRIDPLPLGVVMGSALGGETRVRADVCVVGTGAGGAVAAARLAQAGHQVVMLEEGGFWRGGDFNEFEADMMPRLYADGGARATEDLAVPLLQGRSVGGGTTVNWLIMLRAPEWVLDEWAAEHGTEGMRPAELAPVFDRVERETHALPVPDDAHSPANRMLMEGARSLGWRVRHARINARGCVRSGFCGLGCRYDARQGTAAVHVPAALAAGARLFTDARADRVEVAGRGGRAPLKRVHATVIDRETGRPRGTLVVEAPVVVAAGGAVGTPALLQRSGLGGGGVGRYLRLHPTTVVSGDYGREMYQSGGIPLSAVCDEFLKAGPGGYGFWIECPPLYPALASVALPGFGADHREQMERLERIAPFIVLVRDGAEKALSQGSVTVDRSGKTRIRYRLGRGEWARAHAGIKAAARIHFAAGAGEVRTAHAHGRAIGSAAGLDEIDRRPVGPNLLGMMSAHVNGTCRIGTDPRTSGCTPDGERHGVPGLYVADGSLLPTAPGVNPQETIMALATVVAERIAERHPAGRAGSAGALAAAG